MRKNIYLSLLIFSLTASGASANGDLPKGYGNDRGYEINVENKDGVWPIQVNTSYTVNGSVQSFDGMAVVRVTPYKPWYKPFSKIPENTLIKISGLPTNQRLHIYYNGYRVHTTAETNAKGEMVLSRPTGRGIQLIIKETPSTHHIAIDPLFGPLGGDCEDIGSWDAGAKKCTLTTNVFETIVIDDEGITLDGNGYEVNGGLVGDGIYTDVSSVTIKNVQVSNFMRGIVFSDSFFTHAAGGWIENSTTTANTTNVEIDGVPSVIISDTQVLSSSTGIHIEDQTDSFPTDNITVRESTIRENDLGLFAKDIEAKFIRNNFLSNASDIQNLSSTLTLNGSESVRGNFWSKNTACEQNPDSPNYCLDAYSGDNLPWACPDAWKENCPYTPPTDPPTEPPTNGTGNWGEIRSDVGSAKLYADSSLSSGVIKILPNSWALEVVDSISSGSFVKVKDLVDNTVLWVKKEHFDTETTSQSILAERAKNTVDTESARLTVVKDAINHYFNSDNHSNSEKGLRVWELDSKSGLLINGTIADDLILASIARESGISNLNNEVVSTDLGHGIMQITLFPERNDIYYLKVLLQNLGYYDSEELLSKGGHNTFDSKVEESVKKFQIAEGIAGADIAGQVSDDTVPALNSRLAKSQDSRIPSWFYFSLYMKVDAVNHFDISDIKEETRARKSGISIFPCSDIGENNNDNNYKKCYSGVIPKSYGPHPNYSNVTFKYYSNSPQSIYANVKDGLAILASKYATYSPLIDKKISSNSEVLFSDSDTNVTGGELKDIVALKAYNGVYSYCKPIGNEIIPVDKDDNASYLYHLSEKLRDPSIDFNSQSEANKFADKIELVIKNKTWVKLCSPVYLEILENETGDITGYNGIKMTKEIGNVVYDEYTKTTANIYLPLATYTYRVKGHRNDDYDMYIENINDGVLNLFTASDIPTNIGSIHEYKPDWNNGSMHVRVDSDGDGVFESEFITDLLLTSLDFDRLYNKNLNLTKITICHIPPGNPAKAHTISIGESAWDAHQKHGDYEGECVDSVVNGKVMKDKSKERKR